MNDIEFAREFPDPYADRVSPLVLDRQRIVHSAAFRRLQHKTQVFVAPESDHFRTRLTHTLEVAHLARHIADRLALRADLAEVVALAHDLGHPPFGHAGEKALDRCMRPHGGFEHNRHTLRTVEELEHPYPEFHGLNLTRVVRECLAKHSTPFDQPGDHPLQDGRPPPVEGLVVDLADRVTYALHDLQDALYAELLQPDLLRTVRLWRETYSATADAWRTHLRGTMDRIQSYLLTAIIHSPSNAEAAVYLSSAASEQLAELECFLLERVYHSPLLTAADEQARCIVTAVFDGYIANPGGLPPRFARRVEASGLPRVVADYVAGMTDRFCIQEHVRLSDLPCGPPSS
jgi:dGTPase